MHMSALDRWSFIKRTKDATTRVRFTLTEPFLEDSEG